MRAGPVFVTGGTGYLGRASIDALLARDYPVFALVRPGSEERLPNQSVRVTGDALNAASFAAAIPARATIVHLVGTPQPNPSKAAEFARVDLGSIRATTIAAQRAAASHIVYVSVAHPAPVMQAYVAARVEGEALVAATGIPATILRPWYVLGPGHRWPVLLLPLYTLLRLLPATRGSAERLGLVTQAQMTAALLYAVANPPAAGTRIVDVPGIRHAAS
ncbi:MAG: epimerase [Betaproteobacteria bacterium 13_1_40CM_4_64_4]|nr:MAG: epimerase [Betaproteobacteria bacterium 13_1_40CM_4_64_4]